MCFIAVKLLNIVQNFWKCYDWKLVVRKTWRKLLINGGAGASWVLF